METPLKYVPQSPGVHRRETLDVHSGFLEQGPTLHGGQAPSVSVTPLVSPGSDPALLRSAVTPRALRTAASPERFSPLPGFQQVLAETPAGQAVSSCPSQQGLAGAVCEDGDSGGVPPRLLPPVCICDKLPSSWVSHGRHLIKRLHLGHSLVLSGLHFAICGPPLLTTVTRGLCQYCRCGSHPASSGHSC